VQKRLFLIILFIFMKRLFVLVIRKSSLRRIGGGFARIIESLTDGCQSVAETGFDGGQRNGV